VKKFTKFLKSLPDLKSDSEYKDFEKLINENEQFSSIQESDKISSFLSVTKDLRNQDEGQISDEGLEMHKKKKTKKKRKNRKKNYESSDEDAREDSSDESHRRSESKSQSRSQSKEQRKKKKDK